MRNVATLSAEEDTQSTLQPPPIQRFCSYESDKMAGIYFFISALFTVNSVLSEKSVKSVVTSG
jgi:hypothetical protein